jgi:chemotaxis protein methyltransferase CheR
MNNYIENIVKSVLEQHNVDISRYDESFLAKTIAGRMDATSSKTTQDYISLLAKEPAESSNLIESLTNCHSEFFRNNLTFALLEQFILPRIFKDKEQDHGREVRIWSAGCSGGQEPFSIAILADEYRQTSKSKIGFTLFATDNNEKRLETARQGIYDENALRNVRLGHIKPYFNRKNEQFQVISQIRDQVDYSFFDLLDHASISPPASIYGDFDLIFCSNLLYYYNQETQKKILVKISRALNEGGFLITSEAEKSIVNLVRGFRTFAHPAPVFVKTG